MTNKFLEIAQKDLLEPEGLTESQLQQVLSHIVSKSIDNADLFFQSTYSESWVYEEGILKGEAIILIAASVCGR